MWCHVYVTVKKYVVCFGPPRQTFMAMSLPPHKQAMGITWKHGWRSKRLCMKSWQNKDSDE